MAVKEIFQADNEIKIIGTRHGEKSYETLLTREEMAKAEELDNYYRIPADTRDLNYKVYFSQGEEKISREKDYNSNNTKVLGVQEIKRVLLDLPYIQAALKEYRNGG